MNARILKTVVTIALACVPWVSSAEDIDLFTGATPPSGANLPNVLFVVDNTANWTQPFTNEMSALAQTFAGMPENKFRVGIMFATETGGFDNNVGGGYVRAAVRTMDNANKLKYQTLINALDVGYDKGNAGFSGVQMAEVYRYFSGGAPYAGNQKAKTDYTGNACYECQKQMTAAQKSANAAVYALSGNALNSKNATAYNSPVPTANCAPRNYIIYISNGPNQEAAAQDAIANNMLTQAGGATSMIPLSPNGSQENPADEWARFMKQSPLGVTTFTIDVDPVTNGQGPGWTALLKSMANVSGGKYTAVSSGAGSSAIVDAINDILSQIQSVNTVFASVSLPVSVNTQGSYLNQVYVGMFRPDGNALPRWTGNLKQYKLQLDGDQLRLVDATGSRAVNTSTGFITECARSYWTPSTIDAYWTFKPLGNCIAPAGQPVDYYKNSNSPDGNVVEKGGQAYVLRQASPTARQLKTCSSAFSSCQTTLTNFDTANSALTSSDLSATVASPRDALINWARGNDVQDENTNANYTEARPSVHGDVVHSRPVAVNFGTDALPKISVFYGGNDGILRSINGNRSGSIGSVPAGGEMWGFLPPESYRLIRRNYENTEQISYPGITGAPKAYGPDGPVSSYADGSNRWIYATMRRGGRVLYSFNVGSSNQADVTLKWKRGCPNLTNDSGCDTSDTSWSRIGQTWAAPVVAKVAGYGNGSSPVLFLSGGYDTCEDADPRACSSSRKGNIVYVLNADTGSVLTTFNTAAGVIADVAVVPDAVTGLATYAYVADLEGNIYRINMGTQAPSAWTIIKIASLGCSTAASSCTAGRKFMFTPDVVRSGDEFILLLGSGDREKPLLQYSSAASVENYFFMLRDKPTDANWLANEPSSCNGTICLGSLISIPSGSTTAPTPAQLASKKGWYLGLRATEQVVTASLTIFGTVSFSTHQPQQPSANACTSALGTTRLYSLSYKDGSPGQGQTERSAVLPPVGLPPSPVAGIVKLDDGRLEAFCIGCDKDSPLEAKRPPLPSLSLPREPRRRLFWYIE
ncbi:pilus assembly protein PilY [Solimonas fluminis]|uniref:Pilus assembly protein PilY n=1 Tax=Solimonas fluminis TaxID=2086571 RepID=A0A2S5TJR6_9GAMM|nr:PilC/PilY family type IV pilus protein [Solimonas fluminis]PPE75192.1 pilus assembly protein PilY [Solimonas fluminis]